MSKPLSEAAEPPVVSVQELRADLIERRIEARRRYTEDKDPFDMGVAFGLSDALLAITLLTQATAPQSSPKDRGSLKGME